MKADHVRSLRLNQLLKMALRGAKYNELYTKAMTWGVRKETAKSYLDSVAHLLRVKGKKIEMD